uniref:Fibronectin type-III domain-containing protein n=1 Tax=Seriola lalandi dorsalis TaxID=1841481 RepID=A0A3B4Y3U4_SERLL
MKTSVLLTWEVPETYKSQVDLILYSNGQRSISMLHHNPLQQLQPDTDYSFVLMSRGNSAGGLQQQVSIRTAPNLPPRVPAGAPIRSVSSVCLRGNRTKKRMICDFSNDSEVSSLLSLSLILE